MTLADLSALTDDQLNVMLAELTWFERVDDYGNPAWRDKRNPTSCALFTNRTGGFKLPQFTQDLNETARVASTLSREERNVYAERLLHFFEPVDTDYDLIEATARQRTIALIAVKKGIK